MISGEYLVLAGAKALAMPVRFGQSLVVKPAVRPVIKPAPGDQTEITWRSFVKNQPWVEATFYGASLDIQEGGTASLQHKNKLRQILLAAKTINPFFLQEKQSWDVRSDIDFDIHWGLGSSSTLISNVAAWANVDPYSLLFAVSEGSAYDIACARSHRPLLYTYKGRYKKPAVQHVDFHPAFSTQLFFIYSGKKQSSDESLRSFDPRKVNKQDTEEITMLSEAMVAADNITDFIQVMQTHEAILSGYTGMEPVKSGLFADFPGGVKSLGAWGGDFWLAASAIAPDEIIAYFRKKGFDLLIPFDEMRLADRNNG